MNNLQEKQSAFQDYIKQVSATYKQGIGDIGQDNRLDWVIPFTSYGHYDNSCMVERANYAWFVKHYGKRSGVYIRRGAYGYHAVMVMVNELSSKTIDDIYEYLEQLCDYPCIDDELLSKMEFQAIRQSFNEDWKGELKRNHKSKAWDIIMQEGIGNIAYVEAGGNVYIDWDRLRIELGNY